jgi:hypothetical protein
LLEKYTGSVTGWYDRIIVDETFDFVGLVRYCCGECEEGVNTLPRFAEDINCIFHKQAEARKRGYPMATAEIERTRARPRIWLAARRKSPRLRQPRKHRDRHFRNQYLEKV